MADKTILIRVDVEKETLLGKIAELDALADRMRRTISNMLYEIKGEDIKAAEPMEGSAAEKD